METPSGQPGRAKRKGESEGRVRSCASCRRRRRRWAPGRPRSARRRWRRSSPASLVPVGPARRAEEPRARPDPADQAHAPISNRSLLGLLPLCPAGQGEVGGPKTTPGEEDDRGVQAAADTGAPGRGCGPAGKRASRGGECLGGGARSAETD